MCGFSSVINSAIPLLSSNTLQWESHIALQCETAARHVHLNTAVLKADLRSGSVTLEVRACPCSIQWVCCNNLWTDRQSGPNSFDGSLQRHHPYKKTHFPTSVWLQSWTHPKVWRDPHLLFCLTPPCRTESPPKCFHSREVASCRVLMSDSFMTWVIITSEDLLAQRAEVGGSN